MNWARHGTKNVSQKIFSLRDRVPDSLNPGSALNILVKILLQYKIPVPDICSSPGVSLGSRIFLNCSPGPDGESRKFWIWVPISVLVFIMSPGSDPRPRFPRLEPRDSRNTVPDADPWRWIFFQLTLKLSEGTREIEFSRGHLTPDKFQNVTKFFVWSLIWINSVNFKNSFFKN